MKIAGQYYHNLTLYDLYNGILGLVKIGDETNYVLVVENDAAFFNVPEQEYDWYANLLKGE